MASPDIFLATTIVLLALQLISLGNAVDLVSSFNICLSIAVSGEEECVDRWLVFGNTRVSASVKWDGRFSMSSCILKCHRDMACLAVNYIRDQGECYYLNNAADLHNRSVKDNQTVIVIGSRCPRPGKLDS